MVCVETLRLAAVACNCAKVLPSHSTSISLPHLLLISPRVGHVKLTGTGLVWMTAPAFANAAGTVDRFLPFLPFSREYLIDTKLPKLFAATHQVVCFSHESYDKQHRLVHILQSLAESFPY